MKKKNELKRRRRKRTAQQLQPWQRPRRQQGNGPEMDQTIIYICDSTVQTQQTFLYTFPYGLKKWVSTSRRFHGNAKHLDKNTAPGKTWHSHVDVADLCEKEFCSGSSPHFHRFSAQEQEEGQSFHRRYKISIKTFLISGTAEFRLPCHWKKTCLQSWICCVFPLIVPFPLSERGCAFILYIWTLVQRLISRLPQALHNDNYTAVLCVCALVVCNLE